MKGHFDGAAVGTLTGAIRACSMSERPSTSPEAVAGQAARGDEDAEPEGNVRHEFVDGELVAMTGTSRAHNTIAGNLVAAIRPHLRGTSCRVASADMKVVSAEAARGYYPGVVVSCGDPAEEPDEYIESRPRLVVEVLSPSTETFDRGDKSVNYRRMESLQEYVLVAQSTQAVEVHGRRDGEWTVTGYGPGDIVTLRSIELELPMAVIYEDVSP